MSGYGIPPRKVNGGLYTGESSAGTPWGNVPIVPEAGNMVRNGLRIGRAGQDAPPPAALYQYVSTARPGNSDPDTDGLIEDPWTGFKFVDCSKIQHR